jgi:hypothetical protein
MSRIGCSPQSFFLGSGLLFLAMLFIGAVTSTSLLGMLAGSDPNTDLLTYGRSTTQTLISVYAMRMAAVFLGQHRRAPHLRAAALGLLPRLPGRADPARGGRRAQMVPAAVPSLGPGGQRGDSPGPPPNQNSKPRQPGRMRTPPKGLRGRRRLLARYHRRREHPQKGPTGQRGRCDQHQVELGDRVVTVAEIERVEVLYHNDQEINDQP